jgi:hypothetical protein
MVATQKKELPKRSKRQGVTSRLWEQASLEVSRASCARSKYQLVI